MSHLTPHKLYLTDAQMKKLLKGHTVQISKEVLGSGMGDKVLHLGKKHSRKIRNAYNNSKGLRLTLEPDEIEVSGAGFLGKAGKALKSIARNKEMQKLGQFAIDYASPYIGQAVSSYTEDPAMGEMASRTVNNLASNALSRYGERKVHKQKRLAGGNIKSTAKDSGKRLIVAGTDRAVRAIEGSGMRGGNITATAKDSGKRLIVAGTDRAVRALDGSGLYGYGIFSAPVESGKKYVRKQEGKLGFGLAGSSVAYKNAMRLNKGVSIDDASIVKAPKGMVNRNVAPAGSLMTLSPYARMNSPAMNPFIPENSYQNSGVSYSMR